MTYQERWAEGPPVGEAPRAGRILSIAEVTRFEDLGFLTPKETQMLVFSHRLLWGRIGDLEAQNEWLNDRLSHAVTYDD